MHNTRTSAKQLRMRELSMQEDKRERQMQQQFMGSTSVPSGNKAVKFPQGQQVHHQPQTTLPWQFPVSDNRVQVPITSGNFIGESRGDGHQVGDYSSSTHLLDDEEMLDFEDNSVLHNILNSSELVSHFDTPLSSDTGLSGEAPGSSTPPAPTGQLSDLTSSAPLGSNSLTSDALSLSTCTSSLSWTSPAMTTGLTDYPVVQTTSGYSQHPMEGGYASGHLQQVVSPQDSIAVPIRILSGSGSSAHTPAFQTSHAGPPQGGTSNMMHLPAGGPTGVIYVRSAAVRQPSVEPGAGSGSSADAAAVAMKVSSSCPAHLSHITPRVLGGFAQPRTSQTPFYAAETNSSVVPQHSSRSGSMYLSSTGTLQEERSSITGSSGVSTSTQISSPHKDRQKKDSHNRVERRRRDLINFNIELLGELVPLEYFRDNDGKKHKGNILSATVNYIAYLRKQEDAHRVLRQEVSFATEAISALLERERELERLLEHEGVRDVNSDAARRCEEFVQRLHHLHQQMTPRVAASLSPVTTQPQQSSASNTTQVNVNQLQRDSLSGSWRLVSQSSWSPTVEPGAVLNCGVGTSGQLISSSAPTHGGLSFYPFQQSTGQTLIKQEPTYGAVSFGGTSDGAAHMELDDIFMETPN